MRTSCEAKTRPFEGWRFRDGGRIADELENPRDTCRVASAKCTRAFLLFSRGLVEHGRVSVGPVLLQLIIIFMCGTFPSCSWLETDGGFVLAEFLPCSTGDHVLFGLRLSALMCVCARNRQTTWRGSTELMIRFCFGSLIFVLIGILGPGDAVDLTRLLFQSPVRLWCWNESTRGVCPRPSVVVTLLLPRSLGTH